MIDFDPMALVRDYGDTYGEARACRTQCALFDFSFMARGRISGSGALTTLAKLQPRRIDDLPTGSIRYTLRIGPSNAVMADLTIWNVGDAYEVMSGRRTDITDLTSFCDPAANCEDLSDETAIFTVQGPDSLAAFASLTDVARLARLKYFTHGVFDVAGVSCRIGRLGYTGERGFEVMVPRADSSRLWQTLAERARPAGFAAADCLRIEAGFILFANECRFGATPAELELSRFAGIETTPRVRLVCFKAQTSKKPVLWQPKAGIKLECHPGEITVTSACHSIVEGCTVGLGYVPSDEAREGSRVRDRGGLFRDAQLVPRPLYDPEKKRPRGPWPEEAATRSARHGP